MKAMRGANYLSAAMLALLSCTQLPRENPPKPPSPLPAGAVPPGAPGTEWSRKTRPERMEFMGLFFFPKMRAIFQSHEPRSVAPFRCQSCHGRDMEAVDFKMPNGLYALPADEPEKAALAYDEKMAKFMAVEVEPAAEGLLGMDPTTGRSCHLCHENE
jgi:cytochrome c553